MALFSNSGPGLIKLFSCSAQLSMKFILLLNLKLTSESSSLLNSRAWKLLLAFSYLLAEKNSCSAKLSMKKVL